MTHLPTVTLKKKLADTLFRGHPWVYRDALAAHTSYAKGTVVSILDESRRPIGQGLYDPTSPIAVRIYSMNPEDCIDIDWCIEKLSRSIRKRTRLFCAERTNAFRLCHGEGDFLPGLVIDRYDDTAVVQFDGEGIREFWRTYLPKSLLTACQSAGIPIKRIYVKERHGAEGWSLWGDTPPREMRILEHGTYFLVNIVDGQKTGFFLDQRENRLFIRSIAAGKTVWNGFCYTGGFSLQAALGGAARVVSVDSAKAAIQTAQAHFDLHRLSEKGHLFFAEDVFTHLHQAIASSIKYDLVIADPPSFAKSQEALPRALAAYADLFSKCMQITEPGGLFAASSCSSHVSQDAFLQTLEKAARFQKRSLQFLEIRGQPMDHPTLPAFPEGRYLKFVLCQIGE